METVDGTLLRMKGYPVHLGHTLEPERPGVKHPCTSGQDQQLHKDDHLSDTSACPTSWATQKSGVLVVWLSTEHGW